MAEAGASANSAYLKLRIRRGNRGPNQIQDNTENVPAPTIVIKKRPPRRPKLENGKIAQNTSISQVVDNELSLEGIERNTIDNAERISEIVPIENTIGQVEEQISLLQLSQESLVLEQLESSQLTPEKSISEKTGKRVRKPRKRNKSKNDAVNQENMESSNVQLPEASTSTFENTQQIEKRKQKEEKQKSYIKSERNKAHKKHRSRQNASEDNESPGNSDKSDANVNKQKSMKEKKKQVKKVFSDHYSVEVLKSVLAVQDPHMPHIIVGSIRINPRCYQNAYVSLTNGDQDILIVGLKDRNRALEGDMVAVRINPPDKWFKLTETTYQKTGAVVSILEKTHPRKAVGFLKKNEPFVYLQPRDSRVPNVRLTAKTIPRNFYDNPDLFKETLFLCNIIDWKKVAFAEGEIVQIVGSKGDLSVETNAILLENDLILTPYGDELLKVLPPPDYIPTESDIAEREDFRKTCIFTIDPATAQDLDDAMSCKPLENGNFEVGVHIADVTHFLEAFSPLDRKVAERATTVYMVDNVYHMLPKQLCITCSLLPGQDKLAFSVILEMTPNGDIVNYHFCKSVINSCCQMSYEQAQIMIEDVSYDWQKDSTFKIVGDYKPSDLVIIVQNLYKLSTKLRDKRFEEGALRIDQPKLCMLLDRATGLPVSYKLEERKESSSLIEEFMLLANMTVAKYLYETLPEVSLLRSHAEPSMRILSKTRNLLTKFGVILDVDSAGSLHNSLLMYQNHSTDETSQDVDFAQYRMMVINTLCAKSMTRAVYKCSATAKGKDCLRHYALNAEFYTHFTSPIRRYPDCVVHRLLYASITNQLLPSEWSSQLCQKVASNCNTKKYSAKMAQEQSQALYFTYMLDLQGSMNTLAIVMEVKERSADALLCDTGLKIRIYFSDTIEETTSEFSMDQDVPTVKITWTEQQIVQVINIFSILHVKITKHPQYFRLQGIILPPIKVDVN